MVKIRKNKDKKGKEVEIQRVFVGPQMGNNIY